MNLMCACFDQMSEYRHISKDTSHESHGEEDIYMCVLLCDDRRPTHNVPSAKSFCTGDGSLFP